MCNRFVQNGKEVRPGQNADVLLRGTGGEFDVPYDAAVFGGPARTESRNYWIRQEGAQEVIVPGIQRFGEKDKSTGRQNWADVPQESAMEGLLLPTPIGKNYRLLKVITQPATPEQIVRLGNDRVPCFIGLSDHEIQLPEPISAAPNESPPNHQNQQLELLGE